MNRQLGLLVFLCLCLVGCQAPRPQPRPTATSTLAPAPKLVGSARCAACHQKESQAWMESHHHKAMQLPTEATVLGDFNDTEFDHFGIKTRFERKGDEYWVTTDGPDGVSQSYKVEYTFGVEPLQQYLIKFPDGRLQALSVSWDTEKKRWFHLHPEEKIDHTSSRHWTSAQYNWNFMCAECHSTGVQKNFDAKTKTFHTSYEEINVSCESCHGPASGHLEFLEGKKLPNKGFLVDLAGRGPWKAQTKDSPPKPAHPEAESNQVETCARCHSRRAQFSEDYHHGQGLGQTHSLSLLEPGLYHADGQIDDEVFEHGSFLQSKMYHAGVVCTDCHDPHTSRMKLPGDQQCLSCHSADYQAPQHTHHKKVSCLDCHMPGKHYMVVDERRDHSFRVPRPDLSAEMGAPNACNSCHSDRSVDWAKEAFVRWYGEGKPHHGQVLNRARQGDQKAQAQAGQMALDTAYPEIVRATALSLAPFPEVVTEALKSESALVRREALRALLGAPPEARAQLAGPLAADPVRDVRLVAGRLLAGVPDQAGAWKEAVEEYRQSLLLNADRVESATGMMDLLVSEGKVDEAEATLTKLLQDFPRSPLPYVNGADVSRARGDEGKAEALLRDGLKRVKGPEAAPLAHSLGLSLIRQGRHKEALEQLQLAVRRAPGDRRFAFVLAVALDEQGRTKEALEVLDRIVKTRPHDIEAYATAEVYRSKLEGRHHEETDAGHLLFPHCSGSGPGARSRPSIRQASRRLSGRDKGHSRDHRRGGRHGASHHPGRPSQFRQLQQCGWPGRPLLGVWSFGHRQ